MTVSYREQQRTVIYNLIAEGAGGKTDTIARLTDKVGLSPDKFTDNNYRAAYKAFQDTFIQSQTTQQSFSLEAVFGSIEENYRTNGHAADADKLMTYWHQRKQKLSGVTLPNPYSAAIILMRANIRDQFKLMSDGLYERVRKADDPASELADIAAEINSLASAHGEQTVPYKQELTRAAKMKPVSCGIPWMDDHLFWNKLADGGGFAPGMLVSWFAPSEHGKTATATTFATHWIKRGYPCIMLTAEESRTNFAVRVLNAYTELPASEIIDYIPYLDDTENLTTSQRIVSRALDYMDKTLFTYEIASLDKIEQYIRRHRTQFGEDAPLLAIVDHIGATDSGAGNWSREMEQSAKRLKEIALRYSPTMLVFGQASTQMENDLRKMNYTKERDMRGSHGVRQWSDYVVISCRHNGTPVPDCGDARFFAATVAFSAKNRFRDDSKSGRTPWGVFDFNTFSGTISDSLITDDLHAQMEANFDNE